MQEVKTRSLPSHANTAAGSITINQMKIETEISIGDIVLLFNDPRWRTVCTAITIRASGQIEYLLEWAENGETKEEWFTVERLKCLSKVREKKNTPGFDSRKECK